MAETRKTDVIIPSIFSEYTLGKGIYRSRLYKSAVVGVNPKINTALNGGGEIFTMPKWNSVVGTSGDIPSETVDQTVNNVTAGAEKARRQFRVKAWGANDLSAVLAGSDGLDSAAGEVNDYWAQAFDKVGIASLQGVIADNVANDSGDLVNNVSGGTAAAAYFSDAAVIDAQAKLGENGTVGADDLAGGAFVAIVVHPLVYAYMRKEDLIDNLPVSGQERPVEFYMNMRVVVDRNAPVATAVYDSYICKAGALAAGTGNVGYEATELFRDPKKGFGIDELYTRRAFTVHPYGTAWLETTVTGGISPSDANLILATNWNRVFPAEDMRVVMLKHKIG